MNPPSSPGNLTGSPTSKSASALLVREKFARFITLGSKLLGVYLVPPLDVRRFFFGNDPAKLPIGHDRERPRALFTQVVRLALMSAWTC